MTTPIPADAVTSAAAPARRSRPVDRRARSAERTARTRALSAQRIPELPLEVAQVRLRIHRPADRALQQLLRRERAAVPVHVLAQPLAQGLELAALELLVEAADFRLRPLPQLHGDDVPERVRR